jgi:putative nucleotidyltransferase with HDIG domain
VKKFVPYLDPKTRLADRLERSYRELELIQVQRQGVEALLAPLRAKDQETYEHSIRVGLLARLIAHFVHLDDRPAFYAGLLHDVGKAQVRRDLLTKTAGWTAADSEEIKAHVLDGYRLVRDLFDFSAEIILWHHRFQPRAYPVELPLPLHDYGEGSRVMIAFFGRILALADCFDALHRVNERSGQVRTLSGEEIKAEMFRLHPDQRVLIKELYEADILTTKVFP